MSTALQEAARLAAERSKNHKRQPDLIDVSEPKPAPSVPTPEQMRHADYAEQEIVERTKGGVNNTIGKAHRRVARFESIEGLSSDHLRSLRFYRAAFDEADLSATKSALDIRPRGSGSDGAISRLETIVSAGMMLSRIELAVPPPLLATLRAVAGRDMDFKALAIERFGGRDVQRIDTGKRKPRVTTALEPKSGRHRAIIRDEFLAAAQALVNITRPMMSTERLHPFHADHPVASVNDEAPAAARPAPAAIDPAFLDVDGRMRPMDEIAEMIRSRPLDDAA